MELTDIRLFPVKSLAGIQVENAQVTPMGLKDDRAMMLVDEQGVFISQRKFPQMALIKTKLEANAVQVSAPDLESLALEASAFSEESLQVTVWGTQCFGYLANDNINQWFSEFLEQPVRLVQYDRQQPRASDPDFSQPGDIVSFADGFPLLVISQASLDDLNSRLQVPVTMTSFRPNIVVDGCDAYAEDDWKKIRVGEVEFEAVKRCSRCVLTTVDPQTGIKREDREPLKTLSGYRRASAGVMFGMNLIPRNEGRIKLSDKVEILS